MLRPAQPRRRGRRLSSGPMSYEVEFESTLFRVEGKGGWTFAPVPEDLAPSTSGAWGRIPVLATIDGTGWKTSLWRERSGRVLLAVPKHVRRGKEHGARVRVQLRFSHL
jgi:hypothetical protein